MEDPIKYMQKFFNTENVYIISILGPNDSPKIESENNVITLFFDDTEVEGRPGLKAFTDNDAKNVVNLISKIDTKENYILLT